MKSIAEYLDIIDKALLDIRAAIEKEGIPIGETLPRDYASLIRRIGAGSELGSAMNWLDYETADNYRFISQLLQSYRDTKDWTDLSQAKGNSNVYYLPRFDLSNLESAIGLLQDMPNLKVANLDTLYVKNISYLVGGCTSLTDLSPILADRVEHAVSPFYSCMELTNFGGLIGIKTSFTLGASSKLTYTSLISCIDGLGDVSGETPRTLTLHPNSLGQLTDDDIAIAVSKNWTIKA